MICKKCGNEMEENQLVCPRCGADVRVVPEYGRLDNELQKSMEKLKTGSVAEEKGFELQFDRDKIAGTRDLKIPANSYRREKREEDSVPGREFTPLQKRSRNPEPVRKERETYKDEEPVEEEEWDDYEEDEWEEEEFHLEKRTTAKQKKVKLIASIAAVSIVIVALISGIVIYAVTSVSSSSYERQLEAGDESWKEGKYEDAITSFENAVEKAENAKQKIDAMSKLAALYAEYGDVNSAIFYFESAMEQGKLSNQDVSTLVSLYEGKADINAIRRLAENYSNSETESLFEKHLLNQPIFSYKSGTYSELLTLEITAADNEQIFYTLDNTDATPQSTPYTGPLQIGEGTTVVRAVALNQNGLVSDEIITTYNVKLDAVPVPVITPDTGSYAEATKISIQNIPTNCTAYYTIDGTTPTKDSIPYTEPFDMLLGNNVIMAVCVNNYTEQSSQVAMKIYDLSVNGKVSSAEASGRVMNRLQEMGEVLDGSGTMADGSVCILLPAATRKIGSNQYYIVKRYRSTAAGLREQGTAYAVDVNTGGVFRAEDNGQNEFNLSGL